VEPEQDLAVVIVIQDDREVRLARLSAERRCTLTLLDELARLQLVARAHGWSIVLEDADPSLVELIDLAGLGDTIPSRPRK
jgi:hypothetical protein